MKKLLLQLRILQLKLMVLFLMQKLTIPNLDVPTKIILHHGGGWLNFKGVDAWHKIRWGFRSSLGYYCGYTYFIERDDDEFHFNLITQARRDNEEGAHTKGYNQRTIGICLKGNGVEKDFTERQYAALKTLVDKKRKEYNIPKSEVYGHRDFSPTICPSDPLYNWILKYKGR